MDRHLRYARHIASGGQGHCCMWHAAAVMSAVLTLSSNCAVAQSISKIYWTDDSAAVIQRANLDGSDVEVVATFDGSEPVGIDIDAAAGQMYWQDRMSDELRRANVDGSEIEELLTVGVVGPRSVALDFQNDKVYWTDLGSGIVFRSNANGTDVEEFYATSFFDPFGIAVDPVNEKVYWTDIGPSPNKIQRANLDGTQVEDIVTGLSSPLGIALDRTNNKLYWVDNNDDQINRANIDGSQVETVLASSLSNPIDVAIDVSSQKIYWTDNVSPDSTGDGVIKRANLDGSQVETVLTGLANPLFLVLGPADGPITIDAQPQSLVVVAPQSAQLTVQASGAGALEYQWNKNGVAIENGGNISGAQSETLIIAPTSATDAALYDCAVSNQVDHVQSDAAGLIVESCAGDLDGDTLVNVFDLLDLLAAWGPCP